MMEQAILSALAQQKKRFAKLTDAATLTEQLADAADRNDEVSVQVVLSMRQEPLMHLAEIDKSIRSGLLTLPEEEAIRMHALLGGCAAESPAEQKLTDQIAMNARLLARIRTLDERISRKMGGSESYYAKYR